MTQAGPIKVPNKEKQMTSYFNFEARMSVWEWRKENRYQFFPSDHRGAG
jgi:hypothetical protein